MRDQQTASGEEQSFRLCEVEARNHQPRRGPEVTIMSGRP